MGMRRAHEHRIGLPGQRHVVGVAALPAHQPQVLVARHRPADIGPAPRRRLARTAMAGGHSPSPDCRPRRAAAGRTLSKPMRPCQSGRTQLCRAHCFRQYGAADIVRRMNIVEKAPARTPSTGTDFDRFRLRRFVESLDRRRTRNPRRAARSRRHRAHPRRQRARGAVPRRRARAAGTRRQRRRRPHAARARVRRRAARSWWPKSSAGCATSPRSFEVSRARGAGAAGRARPAIEADLTTLPVHLGHGADGGPYISASVDFVVDPRTGITNVGMRRLMLRGRRETGIDLVSPSDLRAIYEASAAARQAAAGELRGRRASGRPGRRHDAAAGRRARPALARCATRRCRWSSASPTTSACRPTPNG